MNEAFKRKSDETIIDYILRMVSIRKDEKLTWVELADIINQECDCDYSESYYRKALYTNKMAGTEPVDDVDFQRDEVSRLSNLLTDIRKERMKLSDERVQNNAYLRRVTREDSIREIAREVAETISSKKMLDTANPNYTFLRTSDKAGILLLSDWHYGMECDSFWNKYNTDVARKRISFLSETVRQLCVDNNIGKLYVLNLGDLISGRIHFKIRLESRIDVITQTIEVSEILAEFLTDLSSLVEVEYYDCLDNHSRLEPIKTDSLDLESLVRIIPWYLKTRLATNNRIHICENQYSDDIIAFDCFGHTVYGVHGHKDTPAAVIKNLSVMLKQSPELVCTAHRHHFSADEQNEILLVGNGSLMGSDSYAVDNRFTAQPSQTLIVVSKENVLESIHRIPLC